MTAASPCSASDAAELAALIGIPWVEGGQGPDAYDCWAFAGMVQSRFFGRALLPMGAFGAPELRALVAARRAWAITDTPRHGDMVEMRKLGQANHVGVWLDVDRGGVLHCQQGAGVCFDRLDDIRLMGWRARFWTPVDSPAGPVAGGPRGAYVGDIDALLNPGASDPGRSIAAHMAVPIAADTGQTVADIVARAGLADSAIMVFVRSRDVAPDPIDPARLGSAEGLDSTLADLGVVARRDWADRVLGSREVILIQALPQGGGGKSNPLTAILSIIVLVVATIVTFGGAAVFGGTLAGALAGATGLSATAAGALAVSVITAVGNLAINALLPSPSPSGLRGGLTNDTSPTYSASAQGAVARPGAPIPVCYGRHIHQLDDAAPPYARFEDNIQVLYQILCLGEGEHALEEIRLGETAILRAGVVTTNLPGVTFQHVGLGQSVTLCDDAVYTHPDVNGQTLEPEVAAAFQIVTPVGIATEQIEVDVGFQSLVRVNDAGDDLTTSVSILVEAQALDDDDAAVGDVFTLRTLSFTGATRSARRSSHRFLLPEGRYQVRLTRTTPDGGDQVFDEPFWLGLKAILPGGRTYGDVELLAIRVEVGEQIAAQSARRVAAIKTRKLPTYVDGAWTAPVATRSIAWAIADVMRRHDRLADLDLPELIALHATWEARGDKLDVVIDQELSFWEALQGICRAGRAQPDQIGSKVRIWRDEPRALPRQLFSDRNIVRGSLVTRPTLPTRARPQRLVADYIDERTWRQDELSVGPMGGIERRERYFGIANRRQLTDEVSHDYRTARFRTIRVSFEVELEQRLLRRGDLIALVHRQLTTAQAVGIEDWVDGRVTFRAPIDWSALGAAPHLVLTAPDGSVWGPAAIAEGDDLGQTALVAAADLALILDQGGPHADPARWIARSRARDETVRGAVGPASDIYMRLIVEAIGQERSGRASVTCIQDDARAHDGTVALTEGAAPTLAGLDAARRDEAGTTLIDLVGVLAPGAVADQFLSEYSTDGGASFAAVASTASPSVTLTTPADVTHVRMAAVGRARGPFLTVPISAEVIDAPATLVEVNPGQYAANATLRLRAGAAAGAAAYQWRLSPNGGGAVFLRRTATPLLVLTGAELAATGARARVLRASVKAISPSGGASAEIALDLANHAPLAPVNLALAGNTTVTWEGSADADIIAWNVRVADNDAGAMTATPVRVTTPRATVPSGTIDQFTVRVTAIDVLGEGAAATLTYGTRPPRDFGGNGEGAQGGSGGDGRGGGGEAAGPGGNGGV